MYFIRDASEQGANLAVLPEYHLTSWVPNHPEFIATSRNSIEFLSRYQALAQELNVSIVPGTFCCVHDDYETAVPDHPAQRMYNVAYFINGGTGEICSSYQKRNLWHPERPFLIPGTQPHQAFDIPHIFGEEYSLRGGLLICWDLAYPEATRQLIADGAKLIIVPSFWHLSDIDHAGGLNAGSEKVFLNSVMAARAFENTCAVVLCNSGGFSQVSMPVLGGYGKLEPGEETMSVVDVDFDILEIAENNYKVREDMERRNWKYTTESDLYNQC